MVVQLILASRMGTRELESDEEDENAFEVPREQLSKFTGKAPPTKSQLQEAIEKAALEANKPKNNEDKIEETEEEKEETSKLETEETPKSDEVVANNDKVDKIDTDTDEKPVEKENNDNIEDTNQVSETKKDEENASEEPKTEKVKNITYFFLQPKKVINFSGISQKS